MSAELIKVDEKEINENSDKSIFFIDTISKSAIELARDTAIIKESSELLKCSVSIADLQIANDGKGLLGMVIENGRIKEQARFNVADLKSCITPAALYSVASIALGQQFMYEIKCELNSINEKLDEILSCFKDEKIASINAMMSELEYINNTKNKSIEDVIMLRKLALKAEEIRQYAKIKLNHKKDEEKEYFEIYKSAEKINEYSYFLLWQYYLQKQDEELITSNKEKFFCVSKYLQKEYETLAIVKRLEKNYKFLKNFDHNEKIKNFNENNMSICERKNLSELTTECYLVINSNA